MEKRIIATIGIVITLLIAESCNATLITPPQQLRLEGGSEDSSGKWKGGFWIFSVAVDQLDEIEGRIILPANTTQKLNETTEIKTKKSVEIVIKPIKAYYRRELKLAPIEDRIVCPAVYRGCGNDWWGNVWFEKDVKISPTVVEFYEWAKPYWEKYTVFQVKVFVDGKLLGNTTMNTECGENTVTVETPKGQVLIKNLGRLEGDFSEPHTQDVVIFSEKYIFSSEVIRFIRYDHGAKYVYYPNEKCVLCYVENTEAYSTYWFGYVRWNPKAVSDKDVAGTPAPFEKPQLAYSIIAPGKGWSEERGGWFNEISIRNPVKPPIFPEEGEGSLIWYLHKMSSQGNIADTWLSGYEWKIEKDEKGTPKAVIVQIPWGKFSGLPIVTFFIPAELADTFVYRIPLADIKIQSIKWVKDSKIRDKAQCIVELKQFATIESSAIISAEVSTGRASISPTSITLTMKPNEVKNVTFEVLNLGVSEDTEGVIFFTVRRSFDNMVTSTASTTFTLLAPPPVTPENITPEEIVNRTTPDIQPNPKPNQRENETTIIIKSGLEWWQALIISLGVSLLILAISKLPIRKRSNSRKIKKLVKKGIAKTNKVAKTVAQPVWKRYGPQICLIICGIFAFLLCYIFFTYHPLGFFKIGVWEISLLWWHKASIPFIDILLSISSLILGIAFFYRGIVELFRPIKL